MLKLLKVRGVSLWPEVQDGEYVLAARFPILFRIRPGHLVVFRRPGGQVLIKRVERIEPDGSYFVRGSHPESVDSREFGPVAPGNVIGRVVWRWSNRG